MIDNIKFFATNKEEFEQSVCKNTGIDFKGLYDINSGEAKEYPKNGKLFNLGINITKEGACINGSLHKFLNCYLIDEEQNYNDFSYNDLIFVINEIENLTTINPEKTKITNLEFGFNIVVDKDPQEIIDRNVMMYKFHGVNKDLKFRGKGDYKEFETNDYSIKIYNKSKQYSQTQHILRVEIKIMMRRVIQRFGIFTLNDLMDKENLFALFAFFIKNIERVLIVDEFEYRKDISKKDMDKLIKYSSPFHWRTILQKSQSVRNMHIKEYGKLIKKYGLDSLKAEILNKIHVKFDLLLGIQNKRITA